MMTLKVMTANGLLEGEVLYLTDRGTWSPWFDDAVAVTGAAAENQLESAANAAVRDRLVVGPYLMAVTAAGDRLQPIGQREIIRAKGPSIRDDLGKQAIKDEAHVSLR